ncbi:MAG TPA: hypothetical protein VF981_05120 [Gemmatimonadaceae bacterium]
MTCLRSSRVLQAATLLVFLTTAANAGAQTCRGTPRGGGLAFVRGQSFVGSTNGVAAAVAGGRFAIDGDYRSLTADAEGVSGFDASVRFSLLLGGNNLLVCPSLGFVYNSEDWEFGDGGSLTTRTGSARAGLGLGYQREVYKGLSLIPFISADYDFTAIVFTLDPAEEGDEELSGDTLSRVNVQYGILAQYKFFYAGISADRYSDTKGDRPLLARWMVGITFGGSRSSQRRASVAAPIEGPGTVRSPGGR